MSALELNPLSLSRARSPQWFYGRERRTTTGWTPGLTRIGAAQRLFEDALRHHLEGRIAKAIACYERAIALRPDHAEAHNNLAAAMVSEGWIEAAIAHYREALRVKPDYDEALSNLGVALLKRGKLAEAVACHEKAVAWRPDHAGFLYNLALALAAQGRSEDAAARYREVLALKPDHIASHNNLGNLLVDRGHLDEAILHYKQAIGLDPGNAEAHNNLGNALRCQGRFDEALLHYDRAIEIRPAFAEAHYDRVEVKDFSRGDGDLAALEALAGRARLPADKAAFAHFALAKALDDIGDYAKAFRELQHGNDLMRAQIGYDENAMSVLFKRVRCVFTRALMERLQGQGDPSPLPVFVLGMPRSGSTLIEQILAGHPQMDTAGELTAFEETVAEFGVFPELAVHLDGQTLRRIAGNYLSRLPAPDARTARIIDKLPGNFLYIGLIRLAFPNARIIHTVRDPIDTCVSCYSKLFHPGQPYSYNLGELGRYFRLYAEEMNHWRSVLSADAMLEVAYEDVVDEIEAQARRMVEFCGLPWDDRCADRCINFHRARRPVRTASAVQVRKPLFRTSVGRWRAYESGIGALLDELRGVRGTVQAASALSAK